MATLSQQIADFAVRAMREGVPQDVAASTRDRLLDTLGLCVAARTLDTSAAILRYVHSQGGTGQAHVVGDSALVPAPLAALANGVLAHSLDYDDTHLPSVLHPSSSVVPAALAAAEDTRSHGEQLVRATAVGLEVCVRLGMAGYDEKAKNSVFFEHGQHATSICGALGAAVAAGLLLGMEGDEVANAIGIAASMASGLIEANRTGGTVKRLHCGWAAHAGVTAAQLVRAGFTGPPTVLEGRFGFFEAFLRGEYDPAALTEGLGSRWEVPGIFFKPYPANHFTHTAVDAGTELRAQGVDPERISSIVLGVPAPVVRTVGQPLERKQRPTTSYEAQFSGPYAVVVGLLGGGGLGAAVADYDQALLEDPLRVKLMSLVDVVADDECTARFPHQFPSIVHATTQDGKSFEARVLVNRGGPDRPLTEPELQRKFEDNAAPVLGSDRAATLAKALAHIDESVAVSDLLELTCLDSRPQTGDHDGHA